MYATPYASSLKKQVLAPELDKYDLICTTFFTRKVFICINFHHFRPLQMLILKAVHFTPLLYTGMVMNVKTGGIQRNKKYSSGQAAPDFY